LTTDVVIDFVVYHDVVIDDRRVDRLGGLW